LANRLKTNAKSHLNSPDYFSALALIKAFPPHSKQKHHWERAEQPKKRTQMNYAKITGDLYKIDK
jgi:hypothetical protein